MGCYCFYLVSFVLQQELPQRCFLNTLSGVSVSVVTFYQHASITLDLKPVTKLYNVNYIPVITVERLGVVQHY